MQVIPLRQIANQTLTTVLNNQSCRINLYQKYLGLFCDVYINDVLIIGGVLCENSNRIVRSEYLGMSGDLIFFDTAGSDDPYYSGLGSRFRLLYLEPADLTNLALVA